MNELHWVWRMGVSMVESHEVRLLQIDVKCLIVTINHLLYRLQCYAEILVVVLRQLPQKAEH